jgi:hypothetical protein
MIGPADAARKRTEYTACILHLIRIEHGARGWMASKDDMLRFKLSVWHGNIGNRIKLVTAFL